MDLPSRLSGRAARALFLLAFAGPTAISAQVPAADSAALLGITQRLMDAITDGDSAIWAAHLSARWFLTDEEGRHLTRPDFLPELRGLPPGQSGKLKVTNHHLTGGPGVAVLSYDVDEWHDYHGQELRTRFHATDTWLRENGGWKMIASQVTALPTPITGRPVARRLLDAYAGTYALTPDITLKIASSDSGLTILRGSRPPERLYALDPRIFIRHGVRGFWLFERNAAGKVTELAQWRDNNRVGWKRVPPPK